MRTSVLIVVLCASLCSCTDSLYEDLDEKDSHDYMNRANEPDDEEDLKFDQEALFGTDDRLDELPPEEAKAEIKKLLSQIDTNQDGQLDREELFKYLKSMDDKMFLQDVHRVFKKEDTDHDGYITFDEYMKNADMPEDYLKNVENMQPVHKQLKSKFDAADRDHDDRLDADEFSALVYPERHEHMIEHMVRDQLLSFDKDKDGRISFDEYWGHFNPSGKVDADLPDWALNEKREFAEKLDKDKDGYLDTKEVEEWLTSDEQEFFKEEVEHLLQHADKNSDGQLSEEEVLNEFQVFLDSPLTDYGNFPRTHEEL